MDNGDVVKDLAKDGDHLMPGGRNEVPGRFHAPPRRRPSIRDSEGRQTGPRHAFLGKISAPTPPSVIRQVLTPRREPPSACESILQSTPEQAFPSNHQTTAWEFILDLLH